MSKHNYTLPMLPSHAESSSSEATRLRGRWLVIVRTTWVVFVLLSLLIYFASLPAYDAQLQAICTGHVCVPGQLSAEHAQFLKSFGISLVFYASFIVAFNIVGAMVWFAVGVVIFWRRYDDWMALLVALALVLVGATVPPGQSAPFWQWPIQFVDFIAVVALYLVFCIFPSGRFVPGWLRWFALLYAALNVPDLFPNAFFYLPEELVLLYFVLLFGCIGVLGVAQVYRYRRVSSPVERQQIKWIVYGCITTIACEFVIWLLTLLFPSLGQINSLYDLYFNPISIVIILLIPLSVGMAILRSHLWDIDLIIHRTLLYSTLTTVLVLVYSGCVVLLQWLFRTFTGQDSLLAIILSTLIIGVLFQPLRYRIQQMIDRRFYRSKYDAARALSAFSEQMRRYQEVDLTTLVGDVVAIVQETMQPEDVSIWLCEPEIIPADQKKLVSGGLTSELVPHIHATESKTTSGTLLQFGTRPLAHGQENTRQQAETSERGRPLFRLIWLLLAVVTFGLFVVALPLRATHLHIVCSDIFCGGSQPLSFVEKQLSHVGLNLVSYSLYAVILQSVFALACFLVATVVFWRRANDRVALLVSVFLMTFVVSFTAVPQVLWQAYPGWRLPIALVALVGEISLPLCFYLFPNGQFVPGWTRWLLPAWLLWGVLTYLFPDLPIQSQRWFQFIEAVAFVSGFGSIIFAQWYRFRFVSTPVERQQTRWVVFGLAAGLTGFLIAGVLGFLLPQMILPPLGLSSETGTTVLGLIAIPFTYLTMLLIPLSLAMAMLRYRLWEIDMLVNRTMIYSLVFGILGLLFAFSVIAEQRLVQTLLGTFSEVLVVASTLALVMLFRPLLRHARPFITRIFYRRKYQAERKLDDFTNSLREEVNLDQLGDHLLAVVSEAMQPTHISLWIREQQQEEPPDDRRRYTRVLHM